jgi:hypothetical protein
VSRFAAIRGERAAKPAPETPTPPPAPRVAHRAPSRSGKKAVSGYFSRELRLALHRLALDRGLSLQALMGEAFDDLLRKYGRHPFGER